MLIKVMGKRSFQVDATKVKSPARSYKDNLQHKLCYLDPGYDYEVEEAFGADMVKRYPMDFATQGKVNTFPEEKPVEKKKAKKG